MTTSSGTGSPSSPSTVLREPLDLARAGIGRHGVEHRLVRVDPARVELRPGGVGDARAQREDRRRPGSAPPGGAGGASREVLRPVHVARGRRGRRRGRARARRRAGPRRGPIPELPGDHERDGRGRRRSSPRRAALPPPRQAVTTRSTASGARSGPSARTTTAASHVRPERGERRSGARPPAPAPSPGSRPRARPRLQRVGAGHDDDLVHGALPQAREHVRKQQPLLRRAEPRRRPGREHDARDLPRPATSWGLTPGHVRRGRCAAHRPIAGFRSAAPFGPMATSRSDTAGV